MAIKRTLRAEADWISLRHARDYREFLRLYVEKRNLSYSDLAAAAGFTRGFPGDILSGQRRLTTRSCLAFERAMKVPLSARKLFRCLVAVAEPDTFPDLDRRGLDLRIQELRVKSWHRFHKVSEEPKPSAMFKDERLIKTFAACGQPGVPSSAAEVSARTGFSLIEVRGFMAKLVELGLVKAHADRFEPVEQHLFLQSKSQMLATVFANAARLASARVKTAAESDSEMFFVSNFTVNRAHLPELKRKWRELVLQFVDDSVQADGDTVVHLLATLHL